MELAEPPQQRRREGGVRLRPERSRRWCFTTNNYTFENIFPLGKPEAVRYCIYQVERGEEGTEHLQGYIEFKTPRARSAVAAFQVGDERPFSQSHLECARSSADVCTAYCSKEDTRVRGPFRFGEASGGHGKRNDLKVAADEVAKTGSLRNVEPHVLAKYFGGLSKLAAGVPGPFRPDLRIVSLIGSTGIGKSFAIRDRFTDIFSYLKN